jgi:hypothetical protein
MNKKKQNNRSIGIATDLLKEVPIWSPLVSDYPLMGNYDLSKVISLPSGNPETVLSFGMGCE